MTCELNVCVSTVRDWTIEFIDERLNLFNLILQSRTNEGMTDVNECMSLDWTSSQNKSFHDRLIYLVKQSKVLKRTVYFYFLLTNSEAY